MTSSFKLRTRVTFFFILAALPAIMVSFISLKLIDNVIADELTRRRTHIERFVRLSLDNEYNRIRSALKLFAKDSELQAFATKLDDDETLEEMEELAPRLATRAEISAFAILARSGPMRGEIVSSAHLPQAIGDPPRIELGLDRIETATTGIGLDYVADNPPALVPLLIGTETIQAQGAQTLLLYGGTRLDGSFLERIAQMTGAGIELTIAGNESLSFGKNQGLSEGQSKYTIRLAGLGNQPSNSPPNLQINIPLSPLEKSRKQLLNLSLGVSILILLGAFISGLALSRPITEPILDLAAAAREVADGNLQVQVTKRRRDEVGELVDVFNEMVGEIVRGQDELARAERVAAWRDAARQVAHEIKNPLTPMRMSMETLRKAHKIKHESFDEILQESTQAVLEEVQALARIVSAFSEFARLPAPQITGVAPEDILNRSARLYGTMPPNLRINLDSEVILARDLQLVAADRDQIARVLINLIKNAAEAIGDQKGEINLDAIYETRGTIDGVTMIVEDNGPGMTQKIQEEVVKPYFTTKSHGTGLGLAIVERVVHEHQGELSFQSRPDHGTSVKVWLPYFHNSTE